MAADIISLHFARGDSVDRELHEKITHGLLSAPPQRLIRAWYGKSRSLDIVRKIAIGELPATHDALDGIPGTSKLLLVRAFLVEVGGLPWRDENLASIERSIQRRLERLDTRADHGLARRYAIWRVLGTLRARSTQEHPLKSGARNAAYGRVGGAFALLTYMATQGIAVDAFGQAAYDEWCASDPRAASTAGDFVTWGSKQKIWAGSITPLIRRPALPWLGASSETVARRVRNILNADWSAAPHIGFAAALIAQYGIRVSMIVMLTVDDIEISDDAAWLRVGSQRLRLREAMAGLAASTLESRQATQARGGNLLGRNMPVGPWLYPGKQPSTHMAPATLAKLLRHSGVVSVVARRDARTALTLHGVPSPVLSRLLGVTGGTATRWTKAAGAHEVRYLEYLTSRADEN